MDPRPPVVPAAATVLGGLGGNPDFPLPEALGPSPCALLEVKLDAAVDLAAGIAAEAPGAEPTRPCPLLPPLASPGPDLLRPRDCESRVSNTLGEDVPVAGRKGKGRGVSGTSLCTFLLLSLDTTARQGLTKRKYYNTPSDNT